MDLKKNSSLIIGLAIPVLMIIFVAASIYIPAMFVHPQTDFLYMTDDYYNGQWQYEVVNGKLTRTELTKPDDVYREPIATEPKFFVHETTTDTNRELSFEEASALTLNTNSMSPDGFEFVAGRYNGGFLFFGGSYDQTHYLRGHGASKRVTLTSSASGAYTYNTRFLGWISQ